jgi:hypothetical protein
MSLAVLKKLCGQVPWCELAVLEPTVDLALEIAREGREGRRIGTLFTLGKAEAVLAASRPLILDPLAAHAPARTHITDPDLRGTIKELASLFTGSELFATVDVARVDQGGHRSGCEPDRRRARERVPARPRLNGRSLERPGFQIPVASEWR